jgi:DNA-binding CsgD family transcriptional regulator
VAVALEGAERCRMLGLERRGALFLDGNAAELLETLGRWDEAERLVVRGLELEPEGVTALHLRVQQAILAIERGDAERGLELLARADALGAREAGDHFRTGLEAARASALAAAGRPEEAFGAARAARDAALAGQDDQAAATARRLGIAAAADRAAAARARRDAAAVAAACAEGAALVDGVAVDGWPPASLGAAETATAAAELGRLEGRSDPDAWARAAEEWRAIPAPARVAAALLRRADALLAGGASRTDVAGVLTAAHRAARDLGARGLEREAARLAARARVSLEAGTARAPARTVPAAAADLGVTPRELEVLALVAAGRTNRQIAEELVVSVKTAGVHVSNLLRKLGAATRGEAGAIARRAGLVDEATLDRLIDADPR